MALIAGTDPALRAVVLYYDTPNGTVTISRVSPSGAVAVVRGWSDQPATAGQLVIRDFEAPIGVQLTYTAETRDGAGNLVQTDTVTTSLTSGGCGDTWLNDLARVGNTLQILIEALPELSYPVPATVHDVIGRRTPIASSDVAHTPELELSFLTATFGERDQARALLGNAIPVLLRTPPEHGIGNLYFSVTEYAEQRIVPAGLVTDRRFVVSGRQVDRPDPDLYQPIGFADYQHVRDTYATYTDLRDNRASYDAVLYDWSGQQAVDVVPWPPDDA